MLFLSAHVIHEIHGEPTVETAQDALVALLNGECDCVIGIGGGKKEGRKEGRKEVMQHAVCRVSD